MPDGAKPQASRLVRSQRERRRLAQLEAAADPQRFRLLAHAVSHRSFLASEAETLARGSKSRSGNARTTHARRLATQGLLREKKDPVRYEITSAGKAVYNSLVEALRKPRRAKADEEVAISALLLAISGAGASTLGASLAAELTEVLNHRIRERAALAGAHVSRPDSL
jgi:hypothetical protein